MLAKFFIASCLAVSVTAQLSMSQPIPYPGSGSTIPLFSDGSNFPCQGAKYDFDGGFSNTFLQGSTQELAFVGNGMMGGGSCQVSITTDLNPTQNSDWRVIKSIIGGCLASTDQNGNSPDDSNTTNPYTYKFQIPPKLPAGRYSLAWTWFNRAGPRKMYMNCAPITVMGPGGSQEWFQALPQMFVANIGMNHCHIPEGTTVVFPDPGADVDTSIANGDPVSIGLDCLHAPGLGTKIISPAPAIPSQHRTAVKLIPMSTIPEAPAPANSSVAIPLPPPRNSTSEIAFPTAFDAGTPCEDEGDWNCIEGTAFQRCGGGVWSTVTVMPAGVECVAGRASEIEFAVPGAGEIAHRARRLTNP